MLILASQSPRRRELLARLGLEFAVRPGDIDERLRPGAAPQEEVCRLSREKALAVSACDTDIVLAADTIVVLDGKILGKPHSEEEAKEMLRSLSGRTHQVITGFTLRRGETLLTQAEVSCIHFRPLLEEEILSYVASGEPMDKAGAYGIQGLAALFVERLEGDYYNVMGLPLCALGQSLRRFGVKILGV